MEVIGFNAMLARTETAILENARRFREMCAETDRRISAIAAEQNRVQNEQVQRVREAATDALRTQRLANQQVTSLTRLCNQSLEDCRQAWGELLQQTFLTQQPTVALPPPAQLIRCNVFPSPAEAETLPVPYTIPRWSAASEYTAPVDDEQERLEQGQRLVSRVETAIREFINEVLTANDGPHWPKRRLPREMYSAWVQKRETALAAAEPDRPLIWFAEFGDYHQIIMKKDNWREVFQSFFKDMEEVNVSFKRMRAVRNPTSHNRPVTREFLDKLRVEARFVLNAIGLLSPDEKL